MSKITRRQSTLKDVKNFSTGKGKTSCVGQPTGKASLMSKNWFPEAVTPVFLPDDRALMEEMLRYCIKYFKDKAKVTRARQLLESITYWGPMPGEHKPR